MTLSARALAVGLWALTLSCDAGRGGIRPSGTTGSESCCENRVTLEISFPSALSESELRMLAIQFCRRNLCVDVRPDPQTLDCSTDGPLQLSCAILPATPPTPPTLRLTLYGLAQDFVDDDRYQVKVWLGTETAPRIAIDRRVIYDRETATAAGCAVTCSVASLWP